MIFSFTYIHLSRGEATLLRGDVSVAGRLRFRLAFRSCLVCVKDVGRKIVATSGQLSQIRTQYFVLTSLCAQCVLSSGPGCIVASQYTVS